MDLSINKSMDRIFINNQIHEISFHSKYDQLMMKWLVSKAHLWDRIATNTCPILLMWLNGDGKSFKFIKKKQLIKTIYRNVETRCNSSLVMIDSFKYTRKLTNHL